MNIQDFVFPYDYIILFISLIVIIFSFWKGFIQSLLGLLTWIGSIIITIYSYDNFASFISKQILKIDSFKNYESITTIVGIIIAIPLIFLVSLFILKKIRKFLSNDLDKQILGIILDKFFGLVYGCVFSYLIFSTLLYGLDKMNLFNSFDLWILENSYILQNINSYNQLILDYLSPEL
tara:strand:- start:16 stop:549 length:534 start_codon:yes stop_codon:yes gene_type:complete